MAAVIQEAHDRFRIRFAELERGGVAGMFRPERRQVDPFLLCRAIGEVLRLASLRSPAGRPLLWNDYRMILAPADLEPLRALGRRLERDLVSALAGEAAGLDAEVVGDLRVELVADESGELAPGEAVVRVGFAPDRSERASAGGELTVNIAAATLSGEIRNATVLARPAAGRACRLAWQGGTALIAPGAMTAIGRAHQGEPERFVRLTGASPRINKQQAWLLPGPAGVTIGRFPAANPVEVDRRLVAAGQQIEVPQLPVEISLSRGELVLALGWMK